MKVAIVTGASSGMGRQFAMTIKDHGTVDEVWAIARDKKRLNSLAKEMEIPVRIIQADLSKDSSYKKINTILDEESPEVDILINASGFGKFHFIDEGSVEESLNMIDVNCKAVVALTQMVLPHMGPGGRIINIGSVAAFQPIPGICMYGASKSLVVSYTRALNQELRLERRKIRAMVVCPFWTKTGFFDRAIENQGHKLVHHYSVMYDPRDIITRAWHDLKLGKDVSIYGAKAKAQTFMVKLLPHKLIMKIWIMQQRLRSYAR